MPGPRPWIIWGTLALGVWVGIAHADEHLRPTNPHQLEAVPEPAFRVVGARPAYINFAAIRRDFFADNPSITDAEITDWVMENGAYVTEEQLKLSGVRSTDIPIDRNQVRTDYRPGSYGRAGAYEAFYHGKPVGLFESKGAGHSRHSDALVEDQVRRFRQAGGDAAAIDKLRTEDHNDGLMTLGEAIAELTRQTAVQRLFDIHNSQHGTDYQTVETYFILELPFDVLKDGGHHERAAIYGRQAHWRGSQAQQPPGPPVYTDDFGHFQGTQFGAAVDFGGVIPVDPRLVEQFGTRAGGNPMNPQDSRAWAWGHEVARAFAAGDAGAVYRHLAEMVGPIDAPWRQATGGVSGKVFNARLQALLRQIELAKSPSDEEQLHELTRQLVSLPRLSRSVLAENMSPANVRAIAERDPNLYFELAATHRWDPEPCYRFAQSPNKAQKQRALQTLAAMDDVSPRTLEVLQAALADPEPDVAELAAKGLFHKLADPAPAGPGSRPNLFAQAPGATEALAKFEARRLLDPKLLLDDEITALGRLYRLPRPITEAALTETNGRPSTLAEADHSVIARLPEPRSEMESLQRLDALNRLLISGAEHAAVWADLNEQARAAIRSGHDRFYNSLELRQALHTLITHRPVGDAAVATLELAIAQCDWRTLDELIPQIDPDEPYFPRIKNALALRAGRPESRDPQAVQRLLEWGIDTPALRQNVVKLLPDYADLGMFLVSALKWMPSDRTVVRALEKALRNPHISFEIHTIIADAVLEHDPARGPAAVMRWIQRVRRQERLELHDHRLSETLMKSGPARLRPFLERTAKLTCADRLGDLVHLYGVPVSLLGTFGLATGFSIDTMFGSPVLGRIFPALRQDPHADVRPSFGSGMLTK